MNLVVKGALAATGAAVLMIGGVGSLAYWSDAETVTNETVTSGELTLGTPACGSGWMLDATAPAQPVAFTSGMRLVPGDVLTKTCTIDLTASGEHLTATLGVNTPGWGTGNGLTAELTSSASFTVNGVAKTAITPADAVAGSTTEITAVVRVSFPGSAATNASQALAAALGDVVVTATQQPH